MDWIDELRQDLKVALRQLRRTPGFAAAATVTLALGIGATTAVFSLVHSIVLRPLPVPDPERLVRIYSTSQATTSADEASPSEFAAVHRQSRALAAVAAIERRGITLSDGQMRPQQVLAIRTNPDYVQLLGIASLVGRVFGDADDRPGGHRVAVISHGLWMSRFGGDRGVIGRIVRMDAEPFTIVGVMPSSVGEVAGGIDIWAPIAFTPEQELVGRVQFLDVIARLNSGATIASATNELSALSLQHAAAVGDVERRVRVVPYTEDLVGDYRSRLFILLGAVSAVLVIGCVNVANLLLARGMAQRKTLAIRMALGANRARVMRQVLAESLVLGLAGGAVGLLLAGWTARALRAAGGQNIPRLEYATIDAVVLAFAVLAAVTSSVLAGLLPAVHATRTEPQPMLRDGGRSSGNTSERVRRSLVAAEVAISLVLLVGAGLLIRSGLNTQRADPGLITAGVWTGRVTLPAAQYPEPRRLTLTFDRILENVRGITAVTHAAAISVPPFAGLRALGVFGPKGRPLDTQNALMANLRLVSPGAFETLRVPILLGRDFTERDAAEAPPVAIVNQSFARLAWPGEDAIGKRLLGAGSGEQGRDVIAVVSDTREDGLRDESRPAVYLPLRQLPPVLWQSVQNSLFILARTAQEPLGITDAIRDAVAAVDGDLAISHVLSLEQRSATLMATERFNTQLLTALGLIGLLLAGIGTYGVVAFFVARSTRDIGLRIALGASSVDVIRLVAGQGLRPVLAGLAAGTLAAAALTPLLASQLFGVHATDPVTFVGVAASIILAALLAVILPATRAARLDPRVAMDT